MHFLMSDILIFILSGKIFVPLLLYSILQLIFLKTTDPVGSCRSHLAVSATAITRASLHNLGKVLCPALETECELNKNKCAAHQEGKQSEQEIQVT